MSHNSQRIVYNVTHLIETVLVALAGISTLAGLGCTIAEDSSSLLLIRNGSGILPGCRLRSKCREVVKNQCILFIALGN